VPQTVLITGGAGFIGRYVAKALIERGCRVRVLDNLIEQVHGDRTRPEGLHREAEFVGGDVRDETALRRALKGVDKVVHLAAEVGVGQSMYAVERYVSVNDYGTAVLFQQLIERPVKRVVVASSMSVYGEGLYRAADGTIVEDAVRLPRIGNASWDPLDLSGRPLSPAPTPEWKRPTLASVYALTKFVQERLTLTLAPAYGMEGVALRLWNVYGPGQALSNPYTGVLAIFASRLHNGQSPMIFEDGEQRRDFVHVEDIAQAFVLALEHPKAAGEVYNVASGEDRSVREVAALLAKAMNRSDLRPEVTGQARAGDIRHCIADIGKIRQELGFLPRRDFSEGLTELAQWVAKQEAKDRVLEARKELEARGLVA
jgi:dTDP-L-rhamnose 4-epimerase